MTNIEVPTDTHLQSLSREIQLLISTGGGRQKTTEGGQGGSNEGRNSTGGYFIEESGRKNTNN